MKMKSLFVVVILMMTLLLCGSAMAATTVTTASDLIAAAAAGDEIILGASIDMGESTVKVSAVTTSIDLNGYNLTGATAKNTSNTELIVVEKGGNLTLTDSKGSGKISYVYTGPSDNYSYTHNTVTNNQATLTIDGVNLENLTNVSSQISYVVDTRTNGNLGDATTTIKGDSVINSPYYIATRVFANSTTCTGTLIIEDGTFTGRVQMHDANAKANKGVITISGGEFNCNTNDALYVYANTDSSNLSVSVTGGDFNGPIRSVNGAGDIIEGFISGGSLDADPDASLIVPGESTVEVDGRWYLGDSIPEEEPEDEPVVEPEEPEEEPSPAPITGDNSNITLWMGLMLVAALGMMLVSKKTSKAQ